MPWNANGVRSHVVELREFVDKHHPDLILIQETHLRPGPNFNIPNYTTHRNDRINQNSQHTVGGTAILIKSSLTHHYIPTPSHGVIEATSIAPYTSQRQCTEYLFYLHSTK
ncbi:putative RNA-directed DNA polymerase from transposon BS [Trichonephila clavipes]|nr:putative RNA-directed DNA polymerase from transposon BS [Trichonephila clavipes]